MKRKVLIVEDSGLTRKEVREILSGHFDAEVLEAADGLEGLKMLERAPDLELIVTDIEMPELDGIGFIRKVRASEEHCFLPILVMTTLGQTKRRDDALNSGADAFIQKPVPPETFADHFAKALEEILQDVW